MAGKAEFVVSKVGGGDGAGGAERAGGGATRAAGVAATHTSHAPRCPARTQVDQLVNWARKGSIW